MSKIVQLRKPFRDKNTFFVDECQFCIVFITQPFSLTIIKKRNDTTKLSQGKDKDYLDTNSGPTVDKTRLTANDNRKNRHPLPH